MSCLRGRRQTVIRGEEKDSRTRLRYMSMRSAGTLDTRILAVKDDDAIIHMARENSATSDA